MLDKNSKQARTTKKIKNKTVSKRDENRAKALKKNLSRRKETIE